MTALAQRNAQAVARADRAREQATPVDDWKFDAAAERRADEMLGNDDDWCELFERAAKSAECRHRAVALMCEPTCRLDPQVQRVIRALQNAFAAVADEAAREELEAKR